MPTEGAGNTGLYLGIYRVRKPTRSIELKYGFTYTTMKPDLLDKKLLDDRGLSLSTADILGNYRFFEITFYAGIKCLAIPG